MKFLNLSSCGFGDDAAVAFAEMLKWNTGLEILTLCDNEISSAGNLALARAVGGNRSLKRLRFGSFLKATDSSVDDAFVEMLAQNVCLTGLGLDYFREGEIPSEFLTVNGLRYKPFLHRNERITDAVRHAALLLIGICRSATNFDGMGAFAVCPKDVVRLIAMQLWATRTDPIWIQALPEIEMQENCGCDYHGHLYEHSI